MKLKDPKITILFNDDGMSIEVYDNKSSVTFLKAKLNTKQTCQVLSRLGHTDCEAEVFHLDIIGKKMEHKPFEFIVPEYCSKDKAAKIVVKVCPEGWFPDINFSCQGSFFIRNDLFYARTTIKRWV